MERISIGFLLLSLLYMGGLFYLSSLPGGATGPSTVFWRFVSNASHIPLFGGLGFCLAMTFRSWPWPSRALNTLGVGLAYSIFDEYHQSLVPGRTMSVLDISLDLIGILVALSLLWIFASSHHERDRWLR